MAEWEGALEEVEGLKGLVHKVRQERALHGSLPGTLALRVNTWRGFFELSENTYPKGKVESVAVRKALKDSA